MKIFKDLKFYLVVVILAFLGLSVHYFNQRTELEKTKEELTKCQVDIDFVPGGDIEQANNFEAIDSLRSELFIKTTEVARYEMTLEYFKEVNPKAYEQFEKYFYTETE